jgi:hypothetical protein
MSVTVACQCGKKLRVGDENAGKRVKCPYCAQPVAVPKADQDSKDGTLERVAASALEQKEPVVRAEPVVGITPPQRISVPVVPETAIQPQLPSLPSVFRPMDGAEMHLHDRGRLLASVRGRPAIAWHGTVVPSMFGSTSLQLYERRVVETTARVVSARDSEILLTEVDSVELVVKGNAAWIVLGVITIGFFGLGVIFLILYFVLKHRFLIVHSKSNVQAIAIHGDESPYRRFMAAVLSAAESQKGIKST